MQTTDELSEDQLNVVAGGCGYKCEDNGDGEYHSDYKAKHCSHNDQKDQKDKPKYNGPHGHSHDYDEPTAFFVFVAASKYDHCGK